MVSSLDKLHDDLGFADVDLETVSRRGEFVEALVDVSACDGQSLPCAATYHWASTVGVVSVVMHDHGQSNKPAGITS